MYRSNEAFYVSKTIHGAARVLNLIAAIVAKTSLKEQMRGRK